MPLELSQPIVDWALLASESIKLNSGQCMSKERRIEYQTDIAELDLKHLSSGPTKVILFWKNQFQRQYFPLLPYFTTYMQAFNERANGVYRGHKKSSLFQCPPFHNYTLTDHTARMKKLGKNQFGITMFTQFRFYWLWKWNRNHRYHRFSFVFQNGNKCFDLANLVFRLKSLWLSSLL